MSTTNEESLITKLTRQALERAVEAMLAQGTGDRWLARRSKPRCPVDTQVEVLTTDDEGQERRVYAYCRDLSSIGIGIRAREPLPHPSQVTVHFALPDGMYAARARVAHCTQTVGGFKIGLEFLFDEK